MSNRVSRIAVWLVVACSSLASLVAAAQQPAAQAKVKTAPNAALVYWQAFASMPKLTPEQSELLDADPAAASDKKQQDEFRQLLKSSQAALRLLHVAPQMEHCDWQTVQAGPATVLPHLREARVISRLALLRARQRTATGDMKGTVADVLASYRLGRHIRGCLVESLVSLAIERQTNDTVRRILPHLNEATCQSLLAELDGLPKRATFAETILAERDMFGGWLLEQAKQGKLADRLAEMGHLDDAELAQWLAMAALNQDGLEELVQYYNQAAELSKQPQAAEKLAAEEHRAANSSNPLLRALAPAIARSFQSFQKAQADFDETRQMIKRGANP